MALPTGSMTDTDFPYTLTASGTPEYIYFGMRWPRDAKHYSDSTTFQNQYARCFVQMDVAASTDLEIDIACAGLDETIIWTRDETGADVDSWKSMGDSDNPIDGAWIDVDLSDDIQGVCGYLKFDKDGAGAVGVHSVFITGWHGIAYDGESAAVQPRGSTNSLYHKNRFCSSYDLIHGLCETMNRIAYQSRTVISFIP